MTERNTSEFRDGFEDGFEPLESLDLKKIDSFDGLLRAMSKTAFDGRRLGEAADVLYQMVQDKDCMIVGTFSGAMTVAKMGSIICDMIDWGWLDVIISTGALMAHGLVEAAGMRHFKYDLSMNDKELYKLGYDRVYDTLELEKNLDDVEHIITAILKEIDLKAPMSSEIMCREIGRWLMDNSEGQGILKSAYQRNVPVYVPAFTDSEMAIDISTWMIRQQLRTNPDASFIDALTNPIVRFDPFLDLGSYVTQITKAKKIGIFTIGGGVPRNWAQQVSPLLDLMKTRLNLDNIPLKKFLYGIRICPEPVHWGGLSGCTYSEGVSWGKFVDRSEGGRFAEVMTDATVAWPILIKAVKERVDKAERG